MRTNLHFIFPRLVAAMLIVGLASFILFTLFKLLLGLLLIGGIVAVIKRIAGRTHSELNMNPYETYNRFSSINGGNPWTESVSVNAIPVQKTTIVPIN